MRCAISPAASARTLAGARPSSASTSATVSPTRTSRTNQVENIPSGTTRTPTRGGDPAGAQGALRVGDGGAVPQQGAAVVDADGTLLGKYRKHHIPNLPQFWEKFYFRPGNLGWPVFDTAVGRVGVYICYDRHFPEG